MVEYYECHKKTSARSRGSEVLERRSLAAVRDGAEEKYEVMARKSEVTALKAICTVMAAIVAVFAVMTAPQLISGASTTAASIIKLLTTAEAAPFVERIKNDPFVEIMDQAPPMMAEYIALPPLPPSTVDVNGVLVGYVPSYATVTAPWSGAGLWLGSDSTTDGAWGYFIGHNPGDFACVMDLDYGQLVAVRDSAGAVRIYHVVDILTVPNTAYWEDIQESVCGYGESVILQCCVGDDLNLRVVVCQ